MGCFDSRAGILEGKVTNVRAGRETVGAEDESVFNRRFRAGTKEKIRFTANPQGRRQ